MRTRSLFCLAVLLGGCSEGRAGSTHAEGSPAATPVVAQTQQKAQFADDTIINIVDPGVSPSLTVTADIDPVTVHIFYISDKTTNSGHVPGGVTLANTIELDADETAQHDIDTSDPAFQGGYGCILLDSIGDSIQDVFQTYVKYGGSMFSTGGSTFVGGSYRIPYTDGTRRIVLALTNQSDFAFDVELTNLGTTNFKTINLTPLSTFKFDSQAEGWNVSGGTRSIQIFTTNGGTISLSGYQDRRGGRVRITPVKAGPFF